MPGLFHWQIVQALWPIPCDLEAMEEGMSDMKPIRSPSCLIVFRYFNSGSTVAVRILEDKEAQVIYIHKVLR